MAGITLDGSPFATNGDLPPVGSEAPDFRLVRPDLTDARLSAFGGKRKIVSIVPSLETPVCQSSTRKFDELAAQLAETVVLVVSVDTPLAQKRFCDQAGIDAVQTLSTLRTRAFSKDYGVLITSGPFEGMLARAVVVIDERDVVVYSEWTPEIGDEPDYAAVIASLS